jgi:hypothetical protein
MESDSGRMSTAAQKQKIVNVARNWRNDLSSWAQLFLRVLQCSRYKAI